LKTDAKAHAEKPPGDHCAPAASQTLTSNLV
jgi:hypothetical protein